MRREAGSGMDTNTHQNRKTHTVEEAAQVLGIGRNAAYDAAKRGELPTIRIGRRLLVPSAALDRLLEGATSATTHEGDQLHEVK
jgi:excisionase family DNA binding protein